VPKPRRFLNAFTKSEVRSITGISLPMIDYLERHGYMAPAYRGTQLSDASTKTRGKVRYYSYRDLVLARLIQKIRETGVQLARLKATIQFLRTEAAWKAGVNPDRAAEALKWIVFDGKDLLLRNSDDQFLDELRVNGQRSFAFFFDIEATTKEVKDKITDRRIQNFTLEVLPPRPDARPRAGIGRGRKSRTGEG
jgi:DNA-binding transcriptional MerR regulator